MSMLAFVVFVLLVAFAIVIAHDSRKGNGRHA